jgi:hypothetical protein
MVGQLAILNPRRRRKASAKKRVRKMTAKQLKFFGPRKGKKKKAKARKVAARAARAARPEVIIVKSNPKGTRTMAAKKTRKRRRKAKVFTHKSGAKRYRRNPRSLEAGFIKNTLLPSAIGAAGAIGADMLLGYLPVPPMYKTGPIGAALRIGSALVVGAAVGAIAGRESGEEAAAGGVIVTLYQLSRGFIPAQAMPATAMNRYMPMRGYIPMRGYAPAAMGRGQGAFAPRQPGLGYLSPARVAPPLDRGNMRYLASRGG